MSHAQRSHRKYSGSNAARFLVCTKQPDLLERLQAQGGARRDTKYTNEGTKAHEILQTCIETGARPGDIAPTEAIAFSVTICLDYIASIQHQYPDLIIYAEPDVTFPQDVIPPGDAGGHPDVVMYSASVHKVWVVDFKHGEGVIVESFTQHKWYAASFCYGKHVDDIELVTVQPRAEHIDGPIRSVVIGMYDLIEFIALVDRTLRGPKELHAGPHCKWCPLLATCEEAERASLAFAREVFADVNNFNDLNAQEMPSPESLGRARVGKILALYDDFLKPVIDGYRDYAWQEARAGHWIPGWKLVEAEARRHWHGNPAEIAGALMDLSGFSLGLDDVFPRKLMTITDATDRLTALAAGSKARGEKGSAKLEIKEQLAQLTLKESSGNLTFVRESNRRPSVAPAERLLAGVSLPPAAMPVHAPDRVLAAPSAFEDVAPPSTQPIYFTDGR